jgi:methyltransferase-like protein 6
MYFIFSLFSALPLSMAEAECSGSHQDVQAARILTKEEAARLAKDKTLVSEFKRNKLEKEAERHWDLFYKRNTTKFFKDRHWTKREFEDLVGSSNVGGYM